MCWLSSSRLSNRELSQAFMGMCECEIPGVTLIETLILSSEQNGKVVGKTQRHTCKKKADYTVGSIWLKPKTRIWSP